MTLELMQRFSMGAARELANHLWQSSLFLVVVALLALILRNYQARVRYWLWMTASVKFLVPFSLLFALGSHLVRPVYPTASQVPVYMAADAVGRPFTDIATPGSPVAFIQSQPQQTHPPVKLLPITLAVVWLCGFMLVLASWLRQWQQMKRIMRQGKPLLEGREVEMLRKAERLVGASKRIELLSSSSPMEPGVFGIFRPVILWPESISEHLDDTHMEAVLAHEICHVIRRDNLTALIHMLVETLFWFLPFVWWIERQLVKEREAACDEAVLLLCDRPRVYAESILKVCEFCAESSLPCVSGITGADLKKRIHTIMTSTMRRRLGLSTKCLLVAVGLLVVGVPMAFGRFVLPPAMAAALPKYVKVPAAILSVETSDEQPTLLPLETPPPSPLASFQTVPALADSALAIEQSPPAAPQAVETLPSFDVVSIRPYEAPPPIAPGWFMGRLTNCRYSTDRVLCTMTPRELIEDAFQLRKMEIAAPASSDDHIYTLTATMPPGTSKEAAHRMLQHVLIERFQLEFHYEPREIPVYALVPDKNGIKLQPADSLEERMKHATTIAGTGGLRAVPSSGVIKPGIFSADAATIDNLARNMSYQFDLPVVDKPG